MGREVRKVPADWQHPKRDGSYVALFDGAGLKDAIDGWKKDELAWNRHEFPEYANADDRKQSYVEWAGKCPSEDDYMPAWTDAERTHLMMYETTSEGTPISPAFETPEQLARWLADNGASAFGDSTASYEAWLRVAGDGYAPSAMYSPQTGLISGVEALYVLSA